MNQLIDLELIIDKYQCSGLGVEDGKDICAAFLGEGPVKCMDGEGEMIFIIKFKEKVNIHQIYVESGKEEDKYPDFIKSYVNNPNVDFSDTENLTPTETINLKDNLGKKVKVNVPKYKNVNSISVKYFLIFFRFFLKVKKMKILK